jgi:hypothetical protein
MLDTMRNLAIVVEALEEETRSVLERRSATQEGR